MIKILTTNKFLPTARLLKSSLESLGERTLISSKNPSGDLILRWGNLIYFDESTKKVINPFPAIIKANRRNFQEFCIQNSFSTVKFNYYNGEKLKFPLMCRTKLIGTYKGKHLVFVKDESELPELPFWYSEYIPCEREFRVLYCFDRVVKIFEKVPNNPNVIIKNSENCSYKRKDLAYFDKLVNFIEDVLDKFKNDLSNPLIICGLDVGLTLDNEYILFEMNMAPGLNSNSAQLVAQKIKEVKDDSNC